MSAQPTWSPVDDETQDLLTLVANDQMTPRPSDEWVFFVNALTVLGEANEASGFTIPPNSLRPLIRNHVAPRRIGAFTNRAKAEGLIADTGEWQTSDDAEGRNAGKPCRIYRLVS